MNETPPPPSLDVRGLAYAYPDGHQALFGVDLTVGRGERVALLGPNGAGKTTLVLHLNGILAGGVGSVCVAGLPVGRENLAEIRRRVGIVFQDPDDQLFMPSVREDVAFGPASAGMRGPELEARVMAALDRVGMAEFADRPPAPSVVRTASPGGGRHRARDGAGDPGARRALVQPGPGLAA
ncbi:UNVERIFIED_CONTAM: energy-coupling factor transporter ATP-binding protein EcfA2 [Streptomyces graminofaciens]